ncbi:MAG TPA: VOC family protein [Chitinophagaceae bacterium]|nr:VOC family protein [Chitinophagaceae bacterium]
MNATEFRFCYSTPLYAETVSFYKNILQLEEFRSWDRGEGLRGSIFHSPNGTGLIEIEEGGTTPILQGELYIEVEDVDLWYEKMTSKQVTINRPIANTSYGHRSFKIEDPNRLVIGLFSYNENAGV